MYPNLFLKRFWEMDVRPEVFVAMSFDQLYQTRFDNVIRPAIESLNLNGIKLQARRVDLSKSGDSILSEIADGVAHCAVFLADVSTIGTDKATGNPYRNGNVMYEVGLALACRNPEEVLILHDDQHHLLFDLSTIPHKRVDFTDELTAKDIISLALADRLNERKLHEDARVSIAVSSMTDVEIGIIKQVGVQPPTTIWNPFLPIIHSATALARLLDKKMIKVVGSIVRGDKVGAGYVWTELGSVAAQKVLDLPEHVVGDKSDSPKSNDDVIN